MTERTRPGKLFYKNGRPIPNYDWDKADKRSLHIWAECNNPDCNGCMLCAGGLGLCTVCKGFEGSLPKECPGRKMTEQESELVYAGELNFVDNIWWVRKPTDDYKERKAKKFFQRWLKGDKVYTPPQVRNQKWAV